MFANDGDGVKINNCIVNVSTTTNGRTIAGYVYYSNAPLNISNSVLEGTHTSVSRGAGYVYIHRNGDITLTNNTV